MSRRWMNCSIESRLPKWGAARTRRVSSARSILIMDRNKKAAAPPTKKADMIPADQGDALEGGNRVPVRAACDEI
jgi:hypothetical protein